MSEPKLSKLEFQIMEAMWTQGELSIREMQETFAAKRRPAYTTVQTTVYRLEVKGIVRRVRKVGNFHIFAAAVSRDAAQRRLIDERPNRCGTARASAASPWKTLRVFPRSIPSAAPEHGLLKSEL